MENAKKIIIILILVLFSCKSNQEFKHLKDNLYLNKDEQIFMKLSNKNVRNPSQESKWKDTVYRQYFYFKYDSMINLKQIIDIETFRTIIPDEKYIDKKYIYSSKFYKSGRRMHTIEKIYE
ncbi:hypothetical protein J2Q11_13945 [Tenacibaculum finnmarkense genomovar finnmarkense]|uniref:Lipoprotein n=1 Tax=Tenacibaculum finnmarkense genomovar finnmarkense TaxID=1458503 RepID=A0AAP1WHD1_9FLAO|nr:hypothetical protein [Tenacibaculum finnmarkense]MBE7653980.1 hypothetical protein [Tenacibaculum finnmarkense genomovar finnmarkense]MBE7696277.1 hypothetical protein [Tenacibaculum finnmarkense genomovar finnmarkense]MCD8418838.1 hypothetical protein [Tenacibaculum finnmarkense genomovar finnmarkense]MCD8428480.1 hypothetical protein [Tenacibaculum finnmarkense genomovar finnmarkense]MCD8440914.1 hypothetical protein [Tenacibaculum finnmarkense genomovar ulcerans]